MPLTAYLKKAISTHPTNQQLIFGIDNNEKTVWELANVVQTDVKL